MLGPFATASRRTPAVLILHCHSPGVATVARRLHIDVHNNNDDDNAWQRGPLWPHRMGPITKIASVNSDQHSFHQESGAKFTDIVSRSYLRDRLKIVLRPSVNLAPWCTGKWRKDDGHIHVLLRA